MLSLLVLLALCNSSNLIIEEQNLEFRELSEAIVNLSKVFDHSYFVVESQMMELYQMVEHFEERLDRLDRRMDILLEFFDYRDKRPIESERAPYGGIPVHDGELLLQTLP